MRFYQPVMDVLRFSHLNATPFQVRSVRDLGCARSSQQIKWEEESLRQECVCLNVFERRAHHMPNPVFRTCKTVSHRNAVRDATYNTLLGCNFSAQLKHSSHEKNQTFVHCSFAER